MTEYSVQLKNENIDIDAGIKLILAVVLAVAAVFCRSWVGLGYFTAYLLFLTVLLRSSLRFVIKNLLSYGIIILFPYCFGLLLSFLVSKINPGPAYFNHVDYEAASLKMIKIFFIWYIGNLYFFTTPFESIMNMLHKVFSPLNSMGMPVEKYLNMVMLIMKELTRSVSRFKNDIFEQARQIFTDGHMGVRIKIKELSNILAAFIANSLQGTDQIQEQIELNHMEFCQYKLKISKNEMLAIASFMAFLCLLYCADPNYISSIF